MNPLLPALLFTSLAGLLFRRREMGLAWTVVGLAGMAVLSPALLLSDGIPSPSEMLRQLVPWQHLEAGASRNPELMDVTFMIEPWVLHLKRELLAGRMPFWNPYQFSGAPFWGNGSSAPLSPFHWLFVLLPVSMGFTVLAWARVMVGGLGAFKLARELGISREGALFAAVAFPLSGRILCFLLFPMANALALVPWVFLAVERLGQGKPGFRLLAVASALQLVGGHPETALFTGVAAVLYLLLRGAGAPRVTWSAALGGWATGLALAGAALVPLAATILGSARWQHWSPGEPMAIGTILKLWLRFFLPNAYGHPSDGSYWGPLAFVPTSIYCGALVLPLALIALGGWREARPIRAWGLVGLFCLLAGYHFPGLRQVLQATPLLQKSLHHYLLLGFVLAVALLAGCGLDRWRERGLCPALLGAGVLVAVALGAGWLAFAGEWLARQQTATQLGWSLAPVLAVSLLWGLGRLSASRRAALAPVFLLLLGLDLAFTHSRMLPAVSAARLFPSTPALEFLTHVPDRVTATGTWFRPNSAMVFGLSDLRGDDSLKVLPYEQMFGRELGPGDPIYSQPVTQWDSPWLDSLALRWVMTEPGATAPGTGWRLAFDGPDARVWERPSALPLVRLEPKVADSRMEIEAREPGLWRIRVESPEQAKLVIAEVAAPGWRVWINGGQVPVEPQNGLLLGASVPAGGAVVEMRYRPPGWWWGIGLSVMGAAVTAGAGPGRFRRGTSPSRG